MQLPAVLALDDFVKRLRGYNLDESYQDLPFDSFDNPLDVLFASFSTRSEASPYLDEAWSHTHSMLEGHKKGKLEFAAAGMAAALSSSSQMEFDNLGCVGVMPSCAPNKQPQENRTSICDRLSARDELHSNLGIATHSSPSL